MLKVISDYENQGLRVSIRKSTRTDAEVIYQAYQDDEFIKLFRSNTPKFTREEIEQGLIMREQHDPAETGFIEFVVEHPDKGIIGLTLLCDYAPLHNRAEFLVGIFDQDSRTKGLGIDVTMLVLDLAFNRFGLNKVYAYSYGYNDYSFRSAQSLGFVYEATLRDFHYSEVSKQFVDLKMFSILLEEFRTSTMISKLSQRWIGIDITHAPLQTEAFLLNDEQKSMITQAFKQYITEQ